MKYTTRILITLLAVMGFSSSINAQQTFSKAEVNEAIELRQKALINDIGYEIIESLTTEVGPRLAGSDGDVRAVKWAQAKLESLGFDKVWLEPVTFPVWKRVSESAEIIQPYPQALQLTALGFSVSTPTKGITAEVVGFETVEELELAKVGALKGKIAFINHKMKAHRDGHGYGPAVKARSQGASIAAEKGAIALVIRSVGTDSNRSPHTGMLRYKEGIKKIPAAALSSPDADLLMNQLRRKQAVTLHLNLHTEQQAEFTSHNVIGEITGSKYPEQIVALGAHLDSWDLGTGAIDDASGVGIVATAGYLIGQLKTRPKRTIRVILFANEETGLWGGKAYKDKYLSKISQHIVAAESDFGAGRIYRIDASVKAEAWPVIESIAKLLEPLGIELGENKGNAGPDFSPFQAVGLAAIDLKQDGTQYFDWHHTANDTLDKVVAADVAQNVAAYVVIAYLAVH